MQRRKFLKNSTLGTAGILSAPLIASQASPNPASHSLTQQETTPVVLATWDVANATSRAWEVLQEGASSLDAVEQGVMIEEADESNQTVGKGGRPDRDGQVTLDACIMDQDGNCGSVVYLRNIVHAVSVARKVMEETPHVMLAGDGAEKFAYEHGFPKEDLLTQQSRNEWEEWKKTSQYKPIINIENHDTIGMLAIDRQGNISGACTTSGMAYKVAGRIGDSPIIGAGLFVDNEVGGATATGVGEEVVRTVGSFLIVELMRQGKSPQEACEIAVKRIVEKNPDYEEFQVGFIALNKKGETGGYCIQPGFSYRTYSGEGHLLTPAASYITK
ncbi:N(4)-(beta-N-acetylglucosaminyl)-L-asparaginase [Zeaxanthinibacter sp. PT1]|uniref:isoaspartyl peptidase/L-asparaginase family protein n=1 Tax=Zeaxanthinibacter TaxID=561554 RepID=UPI0023494FBE|nr:N(4)-(beta-N-acetylglucosaminyl)-L-asparaginase [Zeaxanthinibacter sp. PT1]MDC6350197.1 N(4)-(beta-N-acetylglucosaminyl)-L-asparaginase [Zeaxanthinibacter sp. PT1]